MPFNAIHNLEFDGGLYFDFCRHAIYALRAEL